MLLMGSSSVGEQKASGMTALRAIQRPFRQQGRGRGRCWRELLGLFYLGNWGIDSKC